MSFFPYIRIKNRNKYMETLKEIKDLVDARIKEGVRTTTIPQVGIHFMKFCGKYELIKLSSQADSYAKWLNAPYKGSLV